MTHPATDAARANRLATVPAAARFTPPGQPAPVSAPSTPAFGEAGGAFFGVFGIEAGVVRLTR